jgi:hypothetical protein
MDRETKAQATRVATPFHLDHSKTTMAPLKNAPLTRPTPNPNEHPHVRPAPMASTPTEILVPRRAQRVQLAGSRQEPLDHDRAQNAKTVTSAVPE